MDGHYRPKVAIHCGLKCSRSANCRGIQLLNSILKPGFCLAGQLCGIAHLIDNGVLVVEH